jgi:hypothetical protein
MPHQLNKFHSHKYPVSFKHHETMVQPLGVLSKHHHTRCVHEHVGSGWLSTAWDWAKKAIEIGKNVHDKLKDNPVTAPIYKKILDKGKQAISDATHGHVTVDKIKNMAGKVRDLTQHADKAQEIVANNSFIPAGRKQQIIDAIQGAKHIVTNATNAVIQDKVSSGAVAPSGSGRHRRRAGDAVRRYDEGVLHGSTITRRHEHLKKKQSAPKSFREHFSKLVPI